MATQTPEMVYSLPAGADLSSSQYCGVKINTSGQFVLAGAGEVMHGILQNSPTSGQQARAELCGRVLKGKVGVGGVTVGARCSIIATTGRFCISATSTHAYVAIALDAVAEGGVARFFVPNASLGAVA